MRVYKDVNSIERNSVWRTDSEEIGIPEGQYRILEVSTKYQMVVLFRLDIEKGLNRPIHIELSKFWEGVEDNLLTKSHYDLPISKKLSEEDMPQNWISRRDAKYQLISDLVENDRFLIELVSRGNPRR